MDVFMESLSEAVLTIVGIVIAGAVSYIVPRVKKMYHKHIEESDLEIVEKLADKAVEFVEEEFYGKSGKIKFNKAADKATTLLNNYGINISQELLQTSIQEGYNRMKERGIERKYNDNNV